MPKEIVVTSTPIYISDNYIRIWAQYDKARPLSILLKDNEGIFEVELLVKRIVGEDNLFEAYTPYGYGGPVIVEGNQYAEFPFEKFLNELKRRNIVDVFVRFSPFLKNYKYFPVNIIELNRYTISRALSKMPYNNVIKTFSRGTKSNIKKSMNCGVDISIINGKDITQIEIEYFYKMYLQNMKVVNATEYYFLNKQCIKDHFAYLGSSIDLFVAKLDNKWIAASLFIKDERMCHYHLGASDKVYSKFRPVDRIFFEAIVFYGNKEKKLLHLGGGLSLTEDDSLFRFKKKFGNIINKFYIGKVIVDKKLYRELRIKKGITNSKYFLINDALKRK